MVFRNEAHIGIVADSGLVHTVRGTSGSVHDVSQAHALLHGAEVDVFADAGYLGAQKRPEAQPGVRWNIALRPSQRARLDKTVMSGKLLDQLEHTKALIRAKVENPFRVLKRQLGRVKVRYRGLIKNTA